MDEITRMPFFKPHLERAEAVALACKPAIYVKPKDAKPAGGAEAKPAAASPIPSGGKVSSRFEKMREKLASNPKSPSASMTGEAAPAAPVSPVAAPAVAAAEASTAGGLDMSAPGGMLDVEGITDQEPEGEGATGVGESMMDVLEFTKSLLFQDEGGDGATLAKRVYDCSKVLRDGEAEDEAAGLERLWEDALGKASNGEEIERVAKEAESLSEKLRSLGFDDQAEEVENIFSEASFDSTEGKREGDCSVM